MNSKHITPKARKCRERACGRLFQPSRPMQAVCSPVCALLTARAKREQAEQKARSEDRKRDREKREGMKTRSDWIKEAQREFNRYIRLRDQQHTCISCAVALKTSGAGGGYDAGHYRSVGSAPHLRFDDRNVHGQCKQCNRWGAGRAVDYRIGLCSRIGEQAVRELEADQLPRKFAIPELIEIRDHYRAKANQLAKQLEKAEA